METPFRGFHMNARPNDGVCIEGGGGALGVANNQANATPHRSVGSQYHDDVTKSSAFSLSLSLSPRVPRRDWR